MRLVSCGSFPPTSPWPRMSVQPIGASISLPLALPSPPQCFDDEFFEEVSQRFQVINSQPVVPSLFDGPFPPSELRRALTFCFDSVVGIDGLPYSVFETNLLWWQSTVLFFNLVLSWAQHCGSCLQAWGPVLAHQLSSHFSHQLLLQNLRAADPCENWPTHLSPTRRMSRGFRWGVDSLVGSLVDLLTTWSSHTFVAFIDIHKACDLLG